MPQLLFRSDSWLRDALFLMTNIEHRIKSSHMEDNDRHFPTREQDVFSRLEVAFLAPCSRLKDRLDAPLGGPP